MRTFAFLFFMTTTLLTASAAEPFRQWVAERRACRELRNDDVTLVRIALAPETMAGCPGPS